MIETVVVNYPEQRTDAAAMAHAVTREEEAWRKIGHDYRFRALSAELRTSVARRRGLPRPAQPVRFWIVALERLPWICPDCGKEFATPQPSWHMRMHDPVPSTAT